MDPETTVVTYTTAQAYAKFIEAEDTKNLCNGFKDLTGCGECKVKLSNLESLSTLSLEAIVILVSNITQAQAHTNNRELIPDKSSLTCKGVLFTSSLSDVPDDVNFRTAEYKIEIIANCLLVQKNYPSAEHITWEEIDDLLEKSFTHATEHI